MYDAEQNNINKICEQAETNNVEGVEDLGLNLKKGFITTYMKFG